MTESSRNIADFAVDLVAALGTDTVFCLTGGMAMFLNRAIAVHPSLKPVYCQHEQACVAAAEGYAKAADFRRPGFALVTAGPGVSNSATALISANGDSTPLIVLAGQVKTADIDIYSTRTHGIQEIRSRELVTPCVKRFLRLDASGYREALVNALADAFSGRPGVVFIEIPLDVQGITIHYSQDDLQAAVECIRSVSSTGAGKDASLLTNCLESLLTARRPLLYVGNGCRIAGVEAVVTELIDRYSIPAVFSWLSYDMLPNDHPLYFGCPGGLAPIYANQILGAADVSVFLGARLDLGTTAFQRKDFGAQATRYFIDIDENELAKFEGFPNSISVRADLRALPAALTGLESRKTSAESTWMPWCEERRASYMVEEEQRLASDKMNVYNIARRLSKWADGKVFVPASSGYAEETFTRFFSPGKGTRFFNGAALGSMGLGLPHSIGASFGSARRVVCLEADGGLMLNLQELATLVHYAPKGFVLFLLNNAGYESIRASQTRYFGGVSGVDRESGLYIPDYRKIAGAFGIRYHAVTTPDELDQILPKLSEWEDPIFVDLKIERFENRGPSVKTILGEDGKPYSTPLAEISW
jgi:acetolactate synthase-1/2/3 large subunit